LWIAVLLCVVFYLLLEPIVGSLQAAGVRKDLAIATALLPPLIALIYFAVYLADVGREYLPQLGADIEQLQQGITRTLAGFDIHLESVLGTQLQLANQVAALDLRGWVQPERLLASTSWLANLLLNLAL